MSVTRSTPKFVYDPTGNESAELSFDTLNLDDETGIMVSDLVSDVNGIKNSFKAALKALPKNTLKGKQYWRFDDTVAHLGKLGYKLEARLESGESGEASLGSCWTVRAMLEDILSYCRSWREKLPSEGSDVVLEELKKIETQADAAVKRLESVPETPRSGQLQA